MTKRYEKAFAELQARREKAFIPFTLLGWPTQDACLSQIAAMVESGVTALELGIAFSDPVADGPIIQKAAFETLKQGFNVSDAFALIARVRERFPNIPIGLLVYYNLILAQGTEKFLRSCAQSGVDAILIADLPVESGSEVAPLAKQLGMELIYIVSPLTAPERLDLILSNAGGFLYLVSRLGVTGTDGRNDQKDRRLAEVISQVKRRSKLPVCAGFGISTPDNARSMFRLGADGVITGSRLIQLVESAKTQPEACEQITVFCREMLCECKKIDVAHS